LLALGIWAGFPWWIVAVLVGYGLHLTTDHLLNKGGPWSYFLVYRAYHRFRKARVFPKGDLDDTYNVLRTEVPFAVWLIKWWHNRSARRQASEQEKGRWDYSA
jgi:hypothetical protein